MGDQVRKDENGALVVKYGTFAPKEREDDDRGIPYLTSYTVCNVETIENIRQEIYWPAEAPFVRNIGAGSSITA